MKYDNLKTLFENLRDDFDNENPSMGHEQRFLEKLKNTNSTIVDTMESSQKRSWWRPLMGIAASIALIVSVFIGTQSGQDNKDLASVSEELSETQNFFTSAIALELTKIESERTTETEALVNDAMEQMTILETEYETLKIDLTESGDDQRVIYAMITNFQNRIELLQSVLKNIEHIKQLKNPEIQQSTI